MYDYKGIIYDPSLKTKNHTSNSHKSVTTMFFKFFHSARNLLCDSTTTFCDPSKDPQYHLQNWALN